MPGSALIASKMALKETDLVDPFLDSEEDEVPVDMEMVFEAMKHVPLPDIDYPEQDYSISGNPTLPDALPGRAIRSHPDPVARQSILKRKIATLDTVQPKKKVGGSSRVPKRVKVEMQSNGICNNKAAPSKAPKVELVAGNVTAAASNVAPIVVTAAKVAAEVAPDIVTSGTVAETGPRPDFSLWTVEDDLLLKNAMEAGAAMEALARGAARFSHRFTMKELRERWRALLYDPEIAEQAAVRMVEAEYANNYSRHKKSVGQKNPQELARKRRANNIRTLYYKKRRKMAPEEAAPDSTMDAVASHGESDLGQCGGEAAEILHDSENKPFQDAATTGSVDAGSMLSKEGLSPDLDDRSFSQMFSLLAAGGITAVIGAIPADMSANVPEQVLGASKADGESRENDIPLLGELSVTMGPKQEVGVLQAENGKISNSGYLLDESIEAAVSLVTTGAAMVLDTTPLNGGYSCAEEGLAVTVADVGVDVTLPPSKTCLEVSGKEVEMGVEFPVEGNLKLLGVQSKTPVPQVLEIHGTINGDVEGRALPGVCPVSLQVSGGKELSVLNLALDNRLIAGVIKFETNVAEEIYLGVKSSEAKDGQPCATSLSSALDHKEVVNGDTDVLSAVGHKEVLNGDSDVLCSSPGAGGDGCTVGPNETELLERCLTMDATVNDEIEEADTVEAMYRECSCGEYCTGDTDEESRDADICYCTAMDQACDNYLPSVLTGESGTRDLDCPYRTDGRIQQLNKLVPGVIQPLVCTFNTEDTEIPSLEDSLLASPSRFSSPSDQVDNVAYAESPHADGGADGFAYDYPDQEVDVNAVAGVEYIDVAAQHGVSSRKMEPDVTNNFCDASINPAELGLSVDRSAGWAALNPGNNVDQARGSLLAVEDEKIGVRCGQVTNSRICTGSTSACDPGGPYTSPSTRNLHQPGALQVSDDVKVKNDIEASDWQTSAAVRVIEDEETQLSPSKKNILTMMYPSEIPMTNGETINEVQEPVEEEVESDEELARFSDIEAMILDMDLGVPDDEFSARAESRRMYRRHGSGVVRAEQCATAAMHRELNMRGAFAVLYGLHSKHYITQTEVVMGRATSDNAVDIDLGREGRANKVSRQQAKIKLKNDGVFYLRNLGRRVLTVNNKSVETGERAILGSNCLIEVAGMRFIFEMNTKLVEEHISKKHQL